MKTTQKILIGVLSVGALVGTGYATWFVTDGYFTKEVGFKPEIETIVSKEFGSLSVSLDEGNNTLRFDNPRNEDLSIGYNVKAEPIKEGDSDNILRDPYDLKIYEGVSADYVPHLTVLTKVIKNGQEVTSNDSFFTYVEVPSVKIDYKEWLSEECKLSGYDITLNFKWSTTTLNGQNPEEAWKNLPKAEQENNYEQLVNALKDVEFKFVFAVGNNNDTPIVGDKTGVIELNSNVTGSKLSVEGFDEVSKTLKKGQHEITLTVEEPTKTLKDNKIIVVENNTNKVELKMDEVATQTKATAKIFKGNYDFKAMTSYKFEYELSDLPPVIEKGVINFANSSNIEIKVTSEGKNIASGEEVEVNKKLNVEVKSLNGYAINEFTYGEDKIEPLTSSLTSASYNVVVKKGTLDINVTHRLMTIAEVLTIENDNEIRTKGKVEGKKGSDALLIHDGHDFISVIGTNFNYKLGDVLEVKGTKSFSDEKGKDIINPTISRLEETLDVTYPQDETITLIDSNYLSTKSEDELKKLSGYFKISCQYLENNTFTINGTEFKFEVLTDKTDFIKGETYLLKGNITNYNSLTKTFVIFEKEVKLQETKDWKEVYGVCVQKDLKDGSENKKFDETSRGYYYEAESAKLFGDSQLEDKSNASGGKLVNRIRTNNGKASGLIFEIESSKDTKALLKTAFAQARRDRHAFKDLLKVEVGQSEETLKEVSINPNYIFEGTNGWSDFKEDVVGEISLTKGKNIIKITGLEGGDKSFNCDYISLLNPYKDESTDSEYIKNTYGTWKYEDLVSTDESFNLIKEKRGTIFEAEKAEKSDTLKVETGKQGVSGESNIGGFGKDEYLTFTVNAKEDTKCLLVIAASGADDRFVPVSSLFNVTYGTSKESLNSQVNSHERYYQYSNDWMKYNNAIVGEVSLNAGVNIIKVVGSVPSDIYQVNIDYMALINAL